MKLSTLIAWLLLPARFIFRLPFKHQQPYIPPTIDPPPRVEHIFHINSTFDNQCNVTDCRITCPLISEGLDFFDIWDKAMFLGAISQARKAVESGVNCTVLYDGVGRFEELVCEDIAQAGSLEGASTWFFNQLADLETCIDHYPILSDIARAFCYLVFFVCLGFLLHWAAKQPRSISRRAHEFVKLVRKRVYFRRQESRLCRYMRSAIELLISHNGRCISLLQRASMAFQGVQIYLHRPVESSPSRTVLLATLLSFLKPIIANEMLFGALIVTYGVIAAFDSSRRRRASEMEAKAGNYTTVRKKELAGLYRNCLQGVEERLKVLVQHKEKFNLLLSDINRPRGHFDEEGQAVGERESDVQGLEALMAKFDKATETYNRLRERLVGLDLDGDKGKIEEAARETLEEGVKWVEFVESL